MLRLISDILAAFFLAAPIVAFLLASRLGRRRRSSVPLVRLGVLTLWGGLMGVGLAQAYAAIFGGRVPIGQDFIAAYFALALLLVMRGYNAVLLWAGTRLLRRAGRWRGRAVLAAFSGVVQTALLFGVGLPVVMATAGTFRAKLAVPPGAPFPPSPLSQAVMLRTDDGQRIIARWTPPDPQARLPRVRPGVAVLYPGVGGAGKNDANLLKLADAIAHLGWGTLAIDPRAAGESSGQQATFGVLEQHDMQAGVQWLTGAGGVEGPMRIVAIGWGSGGAAVIGAAADTNNAAGRRIDGVVAIDTYDDLAGWLGDITGRLPRPLPWLARAGALPLADAITGAPLSSFRPVDLVGQIWPRPILVVHAIANPNVDFHRGQRLFDAALQPKQSLWLGAEMNDNQRDAATTARVLSFLMFARPII